MTTENITDKTILKSWFRRGLKPLESQFHAWMDAYWHKQEKIPTAAIDGLEETLNNKIEKEQLQDLQNNIVITGEETEQEFLEKFLPYLDRILAGEELNLKISYRLIQGEGWIDTYDTVVLTEIIQSDNTPGIHFYINTIYDLHTKNPWHGPTYSSTILWFGKPGNWRLSGHEANTTQLDPIPIYDALDCTDNYHVLSARQGNVLSKSVPLILPVDFRQPYAQIKQSLADAALPYFADGSIHTRPLYLKYIWKDDYTNPAAKVRNAIVGNPSSNFVDGRELRQIITFNSPVRVSDPEQWDYASKIELTYVSSAVDVRMSAYDPGYKNEVMFLIETDNNNTITGSDDNSLVGGSWTELINALRIGKFPDIHLKTTNSGAFCPATYDFVPIAGTSPVRYTGTIRISYPKDTEQEQQIWFEKMYFEEFYGVGSIYNYVGSQQIEAIQKIPLAPGDIIIPVNFELPYPDLNNTISTAIAPYFADGSIYRSPVYLLYIWKNSYTDPTSIIRNLLVSPSEISSGRIFFNSPQKTKIIGNSSSHAHSFEITKTDDGIETVWDDYIPPAPPKHSTIFLYDNGDHALSISDQIFPGVDLNGWQTLHDEIIAVRPPMVYLRTDNSGAFCPATYSFDPLPDRPTVLVGYVEISYIKKTDTGKQLWIERMEFADFTGDGSLYNVNGSELYDGVTKLPIP